MSIQFIARDLYRLQRDVERLEALLKNAPSKEKRELENRLYSLRAERDHLRALLEAKKEPPPYRQPK